MEYGKLNNYKVGHHNKATGKTCNTISFLENNLEYTIKKVYSVRAGDRLDLIAGDEYDDPSLWWLIAFVNKIYDPIFDLKVGQKILIPSVG